MENEFTRTLELLITAILAIVNCPVCQGSGIQRNVNTTYAYGTQTPIATDFVCQCRVSARSAVWSAQTEVTKMKTYQVD